MTTYGTLKSAGESFFTSLLSGRHKNITDTSGALFIDSKPFYITSTIKGILFIYILVCVSIEFFIIVFITTLSCQGLRSILAPCFIFCVVGC